MYVLEAMPDVGTLVDIVSNYGIPSVLLLVFVIYFMSKDKQREKDMRQMIEDTAKKDAEQKAAYEKSIADIRNSNQEIRNNMKEDSKKRENILKEEAMKRENLLREESNKREQALMFNMEKQGESLKEVSSTMSKIENAVSIVLTRIEKLEEKIDRR